MIPKIFKWLLKPIIEVSGLVMLVKKKPFFAAVIHSNLGSTTWFSIETTPVRGVFLSGMRAGILKATMTDGSCIFDLIFFRDTHACPKVRYKLKKKSKNSINFQKSKTNLQTYNIYTRVSTMSTYTLLESVLAFSNIITVGKVVEFLQEGQEVVKWSIHEHVLPILATG